MSARHYCVDNVAAYKWVCYTLYICCGKVFCLFLKSGETVIPAHRAFRAHFVRIKLFPIENRYCYGLKILSVTASFWHYLKWTWKALFTNYRFTSLRKQQPIVYLSPSHDRINLYLKENVEIFARWSYNYHLLKFTCTLCDNTHSAPRYINFFETISILAGDHLVVTIRASHISSWLQEIQSREWEERTKNKEQTRAWFNSSARRLSCDTLHYL